MTTDRWGVDDGWEGTDGDWHPAPAATLAGIAAAMGRDDAVDPPGRDVLIVRPGVTHGFDEPSALTLEDGTELGELDAAPRDLPLGIHSITGAGSGAERTLIVSPGRCHLPAHLRTWGVTMQVPTTRSRSGWGIGDLADVRAVAQWLESRGAGALGLSPLHAPTPVLPLETSPYYPSSRRWRSPLLLRVGEVPGAELCPGVPTLAAEARAAARGPVVDRDAVWSRQRDALRRIWAKRSPQQREASARWRAAQGEALEDWARYCALAEEHGSRWSRWPPHLRHPRADAVEKAAAAHEEQVGFHAWLQELLEDQLQAANVGQVRLIQDLAVGIDPDGADAWAQQDLLALGMSVGAPPDRFAPDGQQWGLPPFVPWRLRDAGYRPFAELLRSSLARGGGLRVDHVMGLTRLFWIPADGSPADGTYVRSRGRDLLEVLALESARAEAIIVGEDLGTVEEGFRDELRATAVLSTRLVWFERDLPERYPREALAMVTTHDLPTVAGVWTGADEAELVALGRPTPAAERGALRARLDALIGLPEGSTSVDAIDAVHRRLGQSAAVLTLGTLEDVCAVPRRPNVPGTTAERSNWSQALPMTVDELVSDPDPAARLGHLAEGRAD